jgi:peptidyl-prolyl cis-trans isomerase C
MSVIYQCAPLLRDPQPEFKPSQPDEGPYVMKVVSAFRVSNPLASARSGLASVLLATLLGTAGPTFAQSAATDRVVATVNGTPIHEGDIEVADEMIGRNLLIKDVVERRDTIIKMYIDTILISQAAKDNKVINEADLQRRITFARNQGLMNNYLTTVGEQAVTDDSVRKAYEDVVAKAANNEPELHLLHMFFLFKDPKDDASLKEAEELAKKAIARLNAGEDFGKVAGEMSEDPVSKAKGGDFEWRGRAEMGEEYAKVAFALKKGEVSTPFKSSVGWHIVKVEDQRTRIPLPLEKIRGRVAAMVAGNAQITVVDKLRAAAKIEFTDAQNTSVKEAPKSN